MIYENFIYIHIPKTAGSSIRSSLNNNYKFLYNASEENFFKMGYQNLNINFENYNFNLNEFKDHLPYQLIKEKKLSNNKYKFTFIRNPFSRMVSLYYECMGNKFHLEGLGVEKNISFKNFVYLVTEKSYWFTIPMIDYIGNQNIDDIDFIGKFENLENDILKLKKKIRIKIKHHNYNNHIKSKFKFIDYRPFYSEPKIIDKIYSYYERDFNQFHYTYEDFIKFEINKIKIITIFKKFLRRKLINLI